MADVTESKSSKFKIFALFGALVGTLLSSWLGPRVIAWWFEPPVYNGVNCRPATEWAMGRLLWVQIIGLGLGLVLGLLLAAQRNSSNRSRDSAE